MSSSASTTMTIASSASASVSASLSLSASSTIATAATPSSTCPALNSIPDLESLPINHKVPVAAAPGTTDPSDPAFTAFTACCSPNKVQLADGCYLWCEVPSNIHDIDEFSNCLRTNNLNLTDPSRIVGFSNDASPLGARGSPVFSVVQMGAWVLVVSGLSSLVFSA